MDKESTNKIETNSRSLPDLEGLPLINEQINTYSLNYESRHYRKIDEPYTEFSYPSATITCWNETKGVIGKIGFYDHAVIPKNEIYSYPQIFFGKINFNFSKFNDIINILRTEESIYFTFNPNTLNGEIRAQGKVKS